MEGVGYKMRTFFEFRIPLITYFILSIAILVLFLFDFQYQPLYTHRSQIGILVLFLGFLIRILASLTIKYLGKIKITGIYALCRQPLLLAQFLSIIGLNIIISNGYFAILSIVVFFLNDYLSMKKYDRILAHSYKEIWKIYAENTNFVIPFSRRVNDFFKQSLSIIELDNSSNLPIFILIYAILIEIATLSNL